MKSVALKTQALQKKVLLITLGLVLTGGLISAINHAFAQQAPQPQPPQNLYAGYSLTLLSKAPQISPYGNLSAQDVYPLITGNALTTVIDKQSASDAPFIINAAAPFKPAIIANTQSQLTVGSMLLNIPANQINNYLQQEDAAFEAPTTTSGTPLNGNSSIANISDPKTNINTITQSFAAPYEASSLFHYTLPPSNPNNNNPAAYTANPGQVYMSLVSGALSPTPSPDSNSMTATYMIKLRQIAAAQTAGVYALQQIYDRSMPLKGIDGTRLNNMMQNDLKWAAGSNNKPVPTPNNQRDFDELMATRRLDPNSGWYQHIQAASPVELQREQLYLQAEMLYEMHQIEVNEEQNKLLLAINLLMQNYNNRATLNQSQQAASPAATKSVS